MRTHTPKKRNGSTIVAATLTALCFTGAFAAAATLAGCSGAAEESSNTGAADQTGLAGPNGMQSINGLNSLNGLMSPNGLSSPNGLNSLNGVNTVNGTYTVNGLPTPNGLNVVNGVVHAVIPDGSTWINDATARSTVGYLIRCALLGNHSITRKSSTGTTYTFTGEAGFADNWMTSPLGAAGEEWVSACMLAHLNGAGQHIQIEMRAAAPSVGYGGSAFYPEGGFYGNIFQSPPKAFACQDWNAMSDFGSGRMCGGYAAGQCPVTIVPDMCNAAYGTDACVLHGTRDGYVSCTSPGKTWTRPVATLLFNVGG